MKRLRVYAVLLMVDWIIYVASMCLTVAASPLFAIPCSISAIIMFYAARKLDKAIEKRKC